MITGLVSAFLLGFWGSLHCIGMCGGIVGVLQNSLSKTNASRKYRKWLFFSCYNLGRIVSYSIAGGIAAFVGSNLLSLINFEAAQRVGQLLSGAFLIAFGLYLAGWWYGLTLIEKKGARLWAYISPATKAFIPVTHLHQAICLGALWGWLPCGLVYSALVWMFTLPDFLQGMYYMAAFGMGTLPMLLFMGGAAEKLSRLAKNEFSRKLAGSIVILFGVITFVGLSPIHTGHDHTDHHQNHQMMAE